MALSITNRIQNLSTSNTTTYTTATYTPGANRLMLLGFMVGDTVDPGPAATVAGNGLTWSLLTSLAFGTVAAPLCRIWLYGALSGGSPSNGGVTMNAFTGGTVNSCNWTIDEVDGADLSGGTAASCIVQTDTETIDTAGTAITSTLGAFASADNCPYSLIGVGGVNAPSALVAPTGWASLSALDNATPDSLTGSAWENVNDTTANWTWTTNSRAGVITVELKALAVAASLVPTPPFPQALLVR